MKRLASIVICCFGILVSSASAPAALVLTADYSMFGEPLTNNLYQNDVGQFFASPGSGRNDVTELFRLNVQTAFNYFQNAFPMGSWNHTVKFTLVDLSGDGADGTSLITGFDGNGRSNMSEIQLDSSAVSHFFVDPTPRDNSEWNIIPKTANLNGNDVNVGRLGKAVAGGPAEDRTDIMTLLVHEVGHSLGLSDNSQRFVDLLGAPTVETDPDRILTFTSAMTGLPNAFDLPFRAASGHVSTAANMGLFADTVTSEPGFGEGDRALLSDVEIYALAAVNGFGPGQFVLNPTAVPEPTTWIALAIFGAVAVRRVRVRKRMVA